jgi:hypothetical protein
VTLNVSLLANKNGSENIVGYTTLAGQVHGSAGLNWGYSNGLPKPNDAYLKISKSYLVTNPNLFPRKASENNLPIDAIWDDGTRMKMLLEGNQTYNDQIYPKQIGSFNNKSQLGIYLRTRIGKKLGIDFVIPDISKSEFVSKATQFKDKLITLDILNKYGRTDIKIKKLEDGTYYFDFSTN